MIRPDYVREQDIPLGHTLQSIAAEPEQWCYYNGALSQIKEIPESLRGFFSIWEILPYVPENERATMRILEVDQNGIFQNRVYGQLTYMGEKRQTFAYDPNCLHQLLAACASIGNTNRVEVLTVVNRKPSVHAFQRFITHDIGVLVLEQGVGIDGSGNIRFFRDRPSNEALRFGKRALSYRQQFLNGDCDFDLEHITHTELFVYKTELDVDL